MASKPPREPLKHNLHSIDWDGSSIAHALICAFARK